jgi:hypothetical protein
MDDEEDGSHVAHHEVPSRTPHRRPDGGASGPTGKAAMSGATNCKKIKNKKKRRHCLRGQRQGRQGQG